MKSTKNFTGGSTSADSNLADAKQTRLASGGRPPLPEMDSIDKCLFGEQPDFRLLRTQVPRMKKLKRFAVVAFIMGLVIGAVCVGVGLSSQSSDAVVLAPTPDEVPSSNQLPSCTISSVFLVPARRELGVFLERPSEAKSRPERVPNSRDLKARASVGKGLSSKNKCGDVSYEFQTASGTQVFTSHTMKLCLGIEPYASDEVVDCFAYDCSDAFKVPASSSSDGTESEGNCCDAGKCIMLQPHDQSDASGTGRSMSYVFPIGVIMLIIAPIIPIGAFLYISRLQRVLARYQALEDN